MQSFNWIDVAILLLLIASVGRGLRIGFIRQVFSAGGFFVGLFTGSFLAPAVLDLLNASPDWSIAGAIVTLFLAGQTAAIGDMIGKRLRTKLHERGVIETTESILGIMASGASVLVVAWLLAAIFIRVPVSDLNDSIDRSLIVQRLNAVLPSAPKVIDRFGNLVNIGEFPRAFVGYEPQPTPTGPPNGPDVIAASNKARASTVKIQGYGCGGIVTGSGFVVGDGLVATNAHVVAGIRRPVIIDDNGRHSATVVAFDPNLDFAILRATNLSGPVLPLALDGVPRGTTAAVVGYPGGGPYTTVSAVVLSRHSAVGRNIYDSRIVTRSIYELQSSVEEGNSGGPMVLPDGRVAGVIFARAVSNEGYGYALTAASVADQISASARRTQPVGTGSCAAD